MRRLLVLPLIALLLSGCAQKPAPVKLATPIRTLGVASNCGAVMSRESLAWFKVGLDDHSTMDVRGWQLDDSVKRLVEARTGITTIDVNADLAKIMKWRGQSVFSSTTQADMLRGAIVPPSRPVDAYLLLTQGLYGSDSNITGPQSVNVRYGIGIFSRINLKLAHVQCNAMLVDARTFERLQAIGVDQTARVEDDLVLDRWEDYTPEQLGRVRKTLTNLWEKGLDDVITRMPLRPSGS